jgi:hypothetical protein
MQELLRQPEQPTERGRTLEKKVMLVSGLFIVPLRCTCEAKIYQAFRYIGAPQQDYGKSGFSDYMCHHDESSLTESSQNLGCRILHIRCTASTQRGRGYLGRKRQRLFSHLGITRNSS